MPNYMGVSCINLPTCHFYFHSSSSKIKTATNNNLARNKVIMLAFLDWMI